MEYIKYALSFLIVLFIYIALIGIFMRAACYIGEKLGFDKFFLNLWEKLSKK